MLPEILLNSPLFGMGLTIIVYCTCEFLVRRLELNIVPHRMQLVRLTLLIKFLVNNL